MSDLPAVTEDNFKAKVLDSTLPVLVEFGATWCHPCKALEPILKALAQDWAGKVTLLSVDVDQCVALTTTYGVMSVPTVFLFVKGQPVERMTGLQSRERLAQKFGAHLN
jgi:thioredoxin